MKDPFKYPIDEVKHLVDEVKQFAQNLVENAKLEAQIAGLTLALDAEKAGAKAAQDFLQTKIDELKAQIKPL